MNVELQIQSSSLGMMAANAVQARLRTTCFPTFGDVYVDHANITGSPVEVFATPATVRVRIPLDVFIVRRQDLVAAPNTVPQGAMTTAGTVILVVELSISNTTLSLRCVDADLGPLGPTLEPLEAAAKEEFIEAIGSPVTTNLLPALKQLGMPTPASSRIEFTGGVVAIRFEPAGPAQVRLFPGQQWGIFLDGAAVEQLAKSKVPKAMEERLTSFDLNAHWRPAGTQPHVDVDYSGKAQVPDPFAGDVSGTFSCDFSVTGPAMRTLRTMARWSINIDLGDFSPAFIDKQVRDFIEIGVFLSVLKAGGVPAGDHAFTLDSALPEVSFSGARLRYASMLASPDGMTVGGVVVWPVPPSRETVDLSKTNFGLPHLVEFCSQLAKTGSGAPHRSAHLDQLTTNGRVWFEDGGTFCDYEILSPNNWLKPFVYPPDSGTVGESHEIRIVIPAGVALGINNPVQLIVHMARGVRLVDLGIPPQAIIDGDGNVLNAQFSYIDDCLYIPVGPDDPFRINWGDASGGLLTNPVDWLSYLDGVQGLDVQLVTLSGLEAGELVQFRSRDHQVNITADFNGRAVVPVLLPLMDQAVPAMLTRVNRQNIDGHVSVASAIFERHASMPAGFRSSLSSELDGTARLTTEFADRVEVHALGQFGAPTLIANEQRAVASLNSAEETQLSSASHNCYGELPGLIALHTIPGFADQAIAIAEMSDQSMLVLDLSDGHARVAGTFSGPIGSLEVKENWGLATKLDRATVFRISRDDPAAHRNNHSATRVRDDDQALSANVASIS